MLQARIKRRECRIVGANKRTVEPDHHAYKVTHGKKKTEAKRKPSLQRIEGSALRL
jgi:hypothetical protein